MKILLVVPRYALSIKPDYDYLLPIGLGYIYSTLAKAGYEVKGLNLNHYPGSIKEIIDNRLNSEKFDFVCTGNNALGYAVTELIIKTAREHSSKPLTILGGPIITSEPELIFQAINPSFGVLGEGEETILELIKFIELKKDLSKVKGIIYKDAKGSLIKTLAREPIQDLDLIPFPNYDAFEIEKQLANISANFIFYTNLFDNTRMYPILASRSCPFQCTFCYHDSRYRRRSMENVMEEICSVVKKYKLNLLAIHDECFALDKARLKEFCKRINHLRKEISWDLKWTCQLRVELYDIKTLKMMKNAGCAVIGYGLESYSPIVLKSMKKNIYPKQIKRALKNAFAAKMALQGFFIFGDIAETKETAKETLDYWKKHCKGQVGLGFIQPYPGSAIYKHCVEKGVIKDKLAFIKDLNVWNWFNMTNDMTDKEILELKNEILISISKYTAFTRPLKIRKMYNGNYEFKVKCPFCKEILIYKNCRIKNRFTYGFNLICRKCLLKFFVVSAIQSIAYANYSKVRVLRDLQHKLMRFLKKRML